LTENFLYFGVIFWREKFLSLPCPQVLFVRGNCLDLGFWGEVGKGKFLSRTEFLRTNLSVHRFFRFHFFHGDLKQILSKKIFFPEFSH